MLEIWVNIDEEQRHRTLRKKLRQLQQSPHKALDSDGHGWMEETRNPHNSAGDSRRSRRWRCSVTRHCGGRRRVSAQADGQFESVVLREMEGGVRHSGEAWEGVVMDPGLIRLHSLPASRASESPCPKFPQRSLDSLLSRSNHTSGNPRLSWVCLTLAPLSRLRADLTRSRRSLV